jgi:hypothetical protein
MQEYELRIYRSERIPTLVAMGSYLSDFAAVRAARTLCREGHAAEVWRDDVCIFAESPSTNITALSNLPAV